MWQDGWSLQPSPLVLQAGMRVARYSSTAAVPLSRMGRRMVRRQLPSSCRQRRWGPMRPSSGGSELRLLLVRYSSSSLRVPNQRHRVWGGEEGREQQRTREGDACYIRQQAHARQDRQTQGTQVSTE